MVHVTGDALTTPAYIVIVCVCAIYLIFTLYIVPLGGSATTQNTEDISLEDRDAPLLSATQDSDPEGDTYAADAIERPESKCAFISRLVYSLVSVNLGTWAIYGPASFAFDAGAAVMIAYPIGCVIPLLLLAAIVSLSERRTPTPILTHSCPSNMESIPFGQRKQRDVENVGNEGENKVATAADLVVPQSAVDYTHPGSSGSHAGIDTGIATRTHTGNNDTQTSNSDTRTSTGTAGDAHAHINVDIDTSTGAHISPLHSSSAHCSSTCTTAISVTASGSSATCVCQEPFPSSFSDYLSRRTATTLTTTTGTVTDTATAYQPTLVPPKTTMSTRLLAHCFWFLSFSTLLLCFFAEISTLYHILTFIFPLHALASLYPLMLLVNVVTAAHELIPLWRERHIDSRAPTHARTEAHTGSNINISNTDVDTFNDIPTTTSSSDNIDSQTHPSTPSSYIPNTALSTRTDALQAVVLALLFLCLAVGLGIRMSEGGASGAALPMPTLTSTPTYVPQAEPVPVSVYVPLPGSSAASVPVLGSPLPVDAPVPEFTAFARTFDISWSVPSITSAPRQSTAVPSSTSTTSTSTSYSSTSTSSPSVFTPLSWRTWWADTDWSVLLLLPLSMVAASAYNPVLWERLAGGQMRANAVKDTVADSVTDARSSFGPSSSSSFPSVASPSIWASVIPASILISIALLASTTAGVYARVRGIYTGSSDDVIWTILDPDFGKDAIPELFSSGVRMRDGVSAPMFMFVCVFACIVIASVCIIDTYVNALCWYLAPGPSSTLSPTSEPTPTPTCAESRSSTSILTSTHTPTSTLAPTVRTLPPSTLSLSVRTRLLTLLLSLVVCVLAQTRISLVKAFIAANIVTAATLLPFLAVVATHIITDIYITPENIQLFEENSQMAVSQTSLSIFDNSSRLSRIDTPSDSPPLPPSSSALVPPALLLRIIRRSGVATHLRNRRVPTQLNNTSPRSCRHYTSPTTPLCNTTIHTDVCNTVPPTYLHTTLPSTRPSLDGLSNTSLSVIPPEHIASTATHTGAMSSLSLPLCKSAQYGYCISAFRAECATAIIDAVDVLICLFCSLVSLMIRSVWLYHDDTTIFFMLKPVYILYDCYVYGNEALLIVLGVGAVATLLTIARKCI